MIDKVVVGDDGEPIVALSAIRDALALIPASTFMHWSDSQPLAFDIIKTAGHDGDEITHELLDRYHPSRSAEALRSHLVVAGALPYRNEVQARARRKCVGLLDSISNNRNRASATAFHTFHTAHMFRDRATARRLRPESAVRIAATLNRFAEFIDGGFHQVNQEHVDKFITLHPSRPGFRSFIRFIAREYKLDIDTTAPDYPKYKAQQPAHKDEALKTIRTLISSEDIPLQARVAGLMVTLYGQPLLKVLEFKVDAIIESSDGEVLFLFGRVPTPLPIEIGNLVQQLSRNSTSINNSFPGVPENWLFPSTRDPKQPTSPASVTNHLNPHGISILEHRTFAKYYNASVLDPASFRDLLGFSNENSALWSAKSGGSHGAYISSSERHFDRPDFTGP